MAATPPPFQGSYSCMDFEIVKRTSYVDFFSCLVFSSLSLMKVYSFIYSSIHLFIHSFIPSFNHSFIHSFALLFQIALTINCSLPIIHSFICSNFHSLNCSFIHPLICSLFHSFIHSFIYSFIRSLNSAMRFAPYYSHFISSLFSRGVDSR